MINTDNYIRWERVDSVQQTATGILAELHRELLRIDVVRTDVLRIKISRGGVFDESPTFAVCVDPLASSPVEFRVEQGPERVQLITADCTASLWLDPFRIDVHRSDGSPVIETAQDPDGRYWGYATLNDSFTLRRRCRQEDAIFGLGEKSGGHNRKGRDFTMWNTDVLSPVETLEFTAGKAADDPRGDIRSAEFDPYYVTIPFFYHQSYPAGSMAASFVDNGYRGAYEFAFDQEYRMVFRGGQYTEYVFAGPDMPAILESYTWLTGRTAPPPIWSLGYHQCRWFEYTQEAVEDIAQRHRDNDIPCDAVWLDIEYMDGYRVFTWNTDRFPDPPGMLKRLDEQGFRVITIIDPGVKFDPGYWVFDQAIERDVLCRTEGDDLYIGQVWPGNTAFPDFVTEEARTWWGELNAAHVLSGLAGIWNDMNEPATGNIDSKPMRFGRGEYSHERYHNQYALLMAMATTAGLLDAMPQRRTFVLSRAGFAGIQRYAANWMGDNQSRWDHLWLSIAMGSGFGISGQAFVGADIGGFQGNSNAELFLRWMQYGTLTPFCRNHSEIGNVDQYAWAFGDVIQDLVRTAIKLRYRLLPYLYACFLKASDSGEPVQRPLIFDYQYDATVRDIDDQFLLGTDLLVAPVIGPGITARQVYLPAGDWYDWHTGELFGGRRFLVVSTPLDRIPLFARGGAVIPMWPEAPDSTNGYHPVVVELHLFVPASDGVYQSMLQEDDGLTFAALAGARYRTTFTVARVGAELTLSADVNGDGYPEFARERFVLVLHGAVPEEANLDDTMIIGSGGRFEIPNRGFRFSFSCMVPE
jgi:alpha-glucosidase